MKRFITILLPIFTFLPVLVSADLVTPPPTTPTNPLLLGFIVLNFIFNFVIGSLGFILLKQPIKMKKYSLIILIVTVIGFLVGYFFVGSSEYGKWISQEQIFHASLLNRLIICVVEIPLFIIGFIYSGLLPGRKAILISLLIVLITFFVGTVISTFIPWVGITPLGEA